jgi:uncharacterized membrane protein HdeD (DUF308 family)
MFLPTVFQSNVWAIAMTSVSANRTSSELEPLRSKRGWIVALGVIYIIAGLIALAAS